MEKGAYIPMNSTFSASLTLACGCQLIWNSEARAYTQVVYCEVNSEFPFSALTTEDIDLHFSEWQMLMGKPGVRLTTETGKKVCNG